MAENMAIPEEIRDMDALEANSDKDVIGILLERNCIVTTISKCDENSAYLPARYSEDKIKITGVQDCLFDEIEDNCFDVIFCGRLDEHSLREFHNEAFRMLRPQGKLYIIGSSVSRDYWFDNLSEAGFRVNLEYDDPESVMVIKPGMISPGVPQRTIIKSPRLLMRPWKREDLDLEDNWPDFVDPIYRHYNPPRDPKIARDQRYERWRPLFNLRLSIFDSEGLAGYIALYKTDMTLMQSDLGIQFAAHKISLGYCKESLRALCDCFFYDWGMKRMRLEVAAFNDYGIRCYMHSGFSEKIRYWHPNAPQRFCNFETNPRLADKKEFFRKDEKGVQVNFVGMAVTSEEYLKLRENSEL